MPGDLTRDVAGRVARDEGTMRWDVAGEESGDTAGNTAGRELRRKATGSAVTSRGVLANPPVRLTGRGGMLAIFALSFAGAFATSVSHVGWLAGICYVVACVLAVWTVRPTQLLPVVVTPPMLLAAAVVCVQAVTASGGALSAAGGTLVTLGNLAPWLFAGTAAGTLIALARGLTGNVHALRESLRGDVRGTRRPH